MGDLVPFPGGNRPASMAAEPYVDKAMAALFLGVSTRTIERWQSVDGGLPAYHLGRVWRYRISELDEWATRFVT